MISRPLPKLFSSIYILRNEGINKDQSCIPVAGIHGHHTFYLSRMRFQCKFKKKCAGYYFQGGFNGEIMHAGYGNKKVFM